MTTPWTSVAIAMASVSAGCSTESGGAADADTAEVTADASVDCDLLRPDDTPCQPADYCTVLGVCYPPEGMPGADCAAPPVPVMLSLSNVELGWRTTDVTLDGQVVAATAKRLELVADGVTHNLDYDFGPYSLPVAIGDPVALRYRVVIPFGEAHGLAIHDASGALLVVADDGNFGSAWHGGSEPAPIPGDFNVRPELAGCEVEVSGCKTLTRIALRFVHEPSGREVTVAPGKSAVLSLPDGAAFLAVNAYAESLLEVECTDQATIRGWFLLATDPPS